MHFDLDLAPTWKPTEPLPSASGLAALFSDMGVNDFSDLHAASIGKPERYWRAVAKIAGLIWRRSPNGYCDLSRGPEFPRWFPGGILNWTDAIRRHFVDPISAERVALIIEREAGTARCVSYRELGGSVDRLVRGLAGLGVKKGDRVGLMLPMGIEAVASFIAVSQLGGILIPLFTGFGSDAVASRLNLSGAKALIIADSLSRRGKSISLAPLVDEVRAQVPSLNHIVMAYYSDAAVVPGMIDWATLDGPGISDPAPDMQPDDPFMIVFTSGTTGAPKGTVHTHAGFPFKIASDCLVHFDIRPGDKWFWPADMGWVVGPITTIGALTRGATLVCYDGAPDFPDWNRIPAILRGHQVTHFGASPTLIRGLAANTSVAHWSVGNSLRVLITAGEVIDPEHFTWYHHSIGNSSCPVVNYTGGTEVSGSLLANIATRPITPGGFNAVSPGIELEIIGEDGQPAAQGELAIKGPFVGMTRSFWNDDRRYLEAYWTQRPGIWIHGDLAARRADGTWFLLGRSDDTLKIAGKRLGPAEVESVLLEHDGIVESAVIGVPDPIKGQKLIVFAVPQDISQARPDLVPDLAARVEKALGKAFRPARIHLVAELPKTRNSKVMRRVIRRIYCGEPLGDLSALENPTAIQAVRDAYGDTAAD